jgi:hypothetical protein
MNYTAAYPALAGRSLVGLASLDDELFSARAAELLSEDTSYIMHDTSIPQMFLSGQEGISAVNSAGNVIQLSEDAYKNSGRQFYSYKIDTGELVYTFTRKSIHAARPSFVYLPKFMNRRKYFGELLLHHMDAFLVYGTNESKHDTLRMESYKKFCMHYEIPIYLFSEDSVCVLSSSQPTACDWGNVWEELQKPCRNYDFYEDVAAVHLSARLFYERNIRKRKAEIGQGRSDLAQMMIADTKPKIQRIVEEHQEECNLLLAEYEQWKELHAVLKQKMETVGDYFAAFMPEDSSVSLGRYVMHRMEENFLLALDLEDDMLAAQYSSSMQKAQMKQAYVCALLLTHKKGMDVRQEDLERLKWEKDTDFIRRAKIRLHDCLHFDETDYMKIAQDLKGCRTPLEHYYRGRAFDVLGHNMHKARFMYEEAYRAGCTEAGERIVALASSGDGKAANIMYHAAELMIPAANYYQGTEGIDKKYWKARLMHMKIAAAQEYLPAVEYCANRFYSELFFGRLKDMEGEEREERLANCLAMLQYIRERAPRNEDALDKIGYIYRDLGDERRALNCWEKSTSALSYYESGRLFEFGRGAFPQDLDRAEEYFQKAVSLGHKRAETELIRVQGWKQKAYQAAVSAQSYNSQRNYSSTTSRHSHRSSGDSGLCFITTAACLSLEKGDTCAELMDMRQFRDEICARDPIVRELVEEYYRIAPMIVEKIDAVPEAREEYERLWKDFLTECLSLIHQGKYYAATQCYGRMVVALSRKYQVELAEGILPKLDTVMARTDDTDPH